MIRCLAVLVAFMIAAPAVGDEPILLKDDPRLRTKIILSLAREPLSLFAETLSKATGVTIRARKDIADKNITAFAKDIPAYEAMNETAKLLDYVWEYTGDTPRVRTYVLVRPLKRKNEAEDLRRAEWKKEDQQFKDGVENAIKMVDADISAWQKAFDKNPAQAVEDYTRRDCLRELTWFTKAQRDDIWERIAASPKNEVRIPFAELPPSLRTHWKDEVTKWHAEAPDQHPSPDGLDQDYYVISRRTGYLPGLPLRAGFTMSLSRYSFAGGWGIRDKDAFFWEEELQELNAAGVNTSGYKPSFPDYAAPESKSKRVSIKFDDKTKDTIFGGHTFAEILEAASETFDVPVFADDYLCRANNMDSARTTFPDNLEEALGEIGREFDYEPTRSGKTVSVRCKTWYLDEPSEVPKRLVMRWVEAKKKQGRLEFRDYLDIVRELTNVQIVGLRSAWVEGGGRLWEALRMTVHVSRLRLCLMLSSDQMQTASESGLGYGDMTPSQQQAFAALLRDTRPDLADEKLPDCAFGMRQETKDREGKNDDTGEPMKWSDDAVVFTYTFALGDEKTFELLLKRKVTKTETTSQ